MVTTSDLMRFITFYFALLLSYHNICYVKLYIKQKTQLKAACDKGFRNWCCGVMEIFVGN